MSKSAIPENQSEVERIKGCIMRLADDKFNQGMKKYYLSALGNDLGEDRLTLEKESKKKLKKFIIEDTDLKIGETGEHKNIFYIRAPDTSSASFSMSSSASSSPRFVPRFWAAFVVPLKERNRRFINLDTLKFESLDNSDIESDHDDRKIEIEEEYIAKKNVPRDDEKTLESIKSWISKHNLEEDRFYMHNHRPQHNVRSLLEHLLMTLDADQLKRTTLSLDIVKSIHDRKV